MATEPTAPRGMPDPAARTEPARGDGPNDRLAQEAKQQAGAIWDDARDVARSTLDKQKQSAASGIGDFAGALRSAARQMNGEQQETASRFAQCAANGLERMSQRLRSKDLNSVVRDVESFAREQPAVFFGAALAAGFLAVRFLKSSNAPGAAGSAPDTDEYHGLGAADPSRRIH